MYHKKAVAILVVLIMLTTPLVVVDPHCIDSDGASADGNSSSSKIGGTKSYNDFVWTDVGDFDTLKTKLTEGGDFRLTADVSSNGDVLEVPAGKNVYVNLNGHTISFDGSPAGNPNAITIKGTASFVFGDDNNSKGKIAIGSTYKGISVIGKMTFSDMVLTENSTVETSAISVDGGVLELDYAEITASRHAVSVGEVGGKVTFNGGIYTAAEETVYDCGRSGSHDITINGGHFNTNADGQYALSVLKTNDSTDNLEQKILVRSGTFNGKIQSISATTEIRGGIFNKDLDIVNNHYRIFMGRFSATNDVSGFIDLTEDAGSIWVPAEESKQTYNEVFQKDSCVVGDIHYYDFRTAFESSNDGSVIEIRRPGTYIMDFQYCHNSKIKGIVDGVVIDCMDSPQNAMGHDVDIENVTFKRANADYLGFLHSASERYTNVTFTSLIYVFGQNNVEFNKCVFHQPRADYYSVRVYDCSHIKFNDCTFNCMGKCVLLYADDPRTQENMRICDFSNCNFYDKGHVQNKAAIEAHTEFGYTDNYTWWGVNVNDCTISGFYTTKFGNSNIYSAVNNVNKNLSKTVVVKIDGCDDFPNKAKFNIQLKSDGEIVDTITDVQYGGALRDTIPPIKQGYIFKGYYDETFTKQYYDAEGHSLMKWDSRSNGVLYAVWTKDTPHNITFDINGATGSVPQTMTVNEGGKFSLPDATSFALQGFKFVGWSDGFKTYLTTETYLMGANDISLKAVWSKEYTPIPVVKCDNVTLAIEDQNGVRVPYVNVYIDGSKTAVSNDDGLAIITSVNAGSKSVRLVCEPNLDKTIVIDFVASNVTIPVTLSDFKVKTLVDTKDSSTEVAVEGLDNVGEAIKGTEDIDVTVTVKVDNTQEIIEKAADKIQKTKELSGKSDCAFFDISVYVKKGTGEVEKQLSVPTMLEFILPFNESVMKSDYVVCHCHTDESGKVTITELKKIESYEEKEENSYFVVNNEMHIFLKKFSEITINYTPSGYNTVAFDRNGGDKVSPEPESHINGQEYILPEYDGVKGEAKFIGWEDADGTVHAAGTKMTMGTSDVTFKAVFKNDTSTITVTALPAEGGTAIGGGTYDVGTEVTLEAKPNTGYHFKEWSDGEKQAKRTITVPDKDTEYAAIFEKDATLQHTVKFLVEGSEPTIVAVDDGKSVERIDDPTKKNMEFVGWFCDDKLWDFNTPVTKDMILVAHFATIENNIATVDASKVDKVEIGFKSDVADVIINFKDASVAIDTKDLKSAGDHLVISANKQGNIEKYDVTASWEKSGKPYDGDIVVILQYDKTKGEPTVYCYPEKGEKQKIDAVVDVDTQTVMFKTNHNFAYGIEYTSEPEPTPVPVYDDGMDYALLVLFILAILAVIGVAFASSKH